jgi:hypothetical protein
VTTPGASESYAGLTITVGLTSYRRGEKLNLNSMNAVLAEGPETDQNHNDVSKNQPIKNQTIKIEFNNADGEHPLPTFSPDIHTNWRLDRHD